MKVMTIVGTRPEIIRLSRVIACLDLYCDHIVVHTGQNYDFELNEIFFRDLELRQPDLYLEAARHNGSETIGNIIIEVDRILEEMMPDAVLVLGDTNSCLSVIPAKRRKIPIFHMEAGNRCFDMRVPEEINRRIVDHTADINLTYSAIARNYLIAEGIAPDTVVCVGSPMREVLNHYSAKIKASKILEKLKIATGGYFLVSAHREENIQSDINFSKLVGILNHIAARYEIPVIVSTHPRTKVRIDNLNVKFHKLVRLLKPLSFTDYNKLQQSARLVLSDSGTITEESSILQFSALNLREAHERPEGMEEGAVMMVGLSQERIEQAIDILDSQRESLGLSVRSVRDYEADNVSLKLLHIIHSYRDYVKRVVWRDYN